MSRILLIVATSVLIWSPLGAQATAWAPRDTLVKDSLLTEAMHLATEGQGDSARALVRRRLAAMSRQDPLYPGALFTAGVVAEHSDSAMSYFRTVSIEYPRSEWADKALLRMAELRFAAGELRSAARSAERVLLDYPFSTVLPRAAFWAGRAHIELGEIEDGCDLLQRALDNAADDIELTNRSRYYMQRCPGVAPDTPAPTSTTTGTVFSVQVAAVSSAAAADELMQGLHRQGYEPHVVRDSDGLLKVRVGRFANRADAQALAAELKEKLGGSPFVVEGS
ncbi:MAG: SPOR domain-containing protein [Gemmatimonadota bacterium]|nr:MAG: SPOR domain-containing protein [Gemmatimonadota bacterium]